MAKETTGSLLLTSIPPEETRRLQKHLQVVQLEFEQRLATVDEPIRYVYFPHNSVTSTLVATDDGPSLEVGLMGAEGMVGLSLLFGEETSNTTVIVQVPGEATRMHADDFKSEVVGRRGILFELLQRYTNAFMGMIAQSAVCNSMHASEERLCKWLLMTHDRVQKDHIPITTKFLAMMLGARRPVLLAAIATLAQAGLIKATRTSVMVLNRKGLEEASCECYEIVRTQYDKIFKTDWRRKSPE